MAAPRKKRLTFHLTPRVFEPVRAACRVLDYNQVGLSHSKQIDLTIRTLQSVRSLAASTLGSILGTYTLSALLAER